MVPPCRRRRMVLLLLTLCTAALLCLGAAPPALAVRASGELLRDADQSLAWVPAANFSQELDRLAPRGTGEFKAVLPPPNLTKEQQSAAVERAELEKLRAAPELTGRQDARPGPPAEEGDAVLWAYASARAALGTLEAADWDRLLETGPGRRTTGGSPATRPQQVPALDLPVPAWLPDEFAEHLRALADFHAGELGAARQRWLRLLDRPEAQRRFRSVWAAFMLGRTWLDEERRAGRDDPGPQAVEWFRQTRRLAKAGFPDPLGLAAASLGWEAYAELRQHHERRAADLYLQLHAAGDSAGDESLALMCRDWFAQHGSPEDWSESAKDPVLARVAAAYAAAEGTRNITRPGTAAVAAWLSAARSAKAEQTVGPARLALVAMQNGDDSGSAGGAAFLAAAPAHDPLAQWLRAKLAVKAGKVDEAVALLASAAKDVPPDETWFGVGGGGSLEGRRALRLADRIGAELGVVELARGNYVEALDRLLRAGWDADADYVAECVLTPEELIDYVNRNWPEQAPERPPDEWSVAGGEMRHLLARRLTRLGRWKEARDYFRPRQQARLDAYVSAIRAGHDADRSDDDRADSFWRAALLAREHGVELFGHETYPAEGAASAAGYSPYTIVAGRQHPRAGSRLGATGDELRRLSVAAPRRYSRLDARRVASEHAWSAAMLMPDESDQTARALCLAGNWLKDEDPAAARRFFRALIERCPTTALGREATRLNWLPTVK